MTIDDLRKKGYKVYMTHYRAAEIQPLELYPTGAIKDQRIKVGFKAKGGMTEVRIVLNDEEIATGQAFCRDDENFCRKIGRDIAIGRAVKGLDLAL